MADPRVRAEECDRDHELQGSEPEEVRYLKVADPDDLWADYDPERVRQGLRRMAGIITPGEGERLKALIYRAREEGSRPADRPYARFAELGLCDADKTSVNS